ncbi:MAG TPA: high frequency lysogenization protein HflD [Xanthomonadaceae bacterium]|jgi:high frequency lysogenization protein|nr:high frequency lysogenization protein HflD [Xanthomonadaceae bacterium]
MKDRALAFAGLTQACKLVRQIADTGDAQTAPLTVCIDSLFRFDADSVESVYGGAAGLHPGLQALVAQIDGGTERDAMLLRLIASVLRVERSYSATRGVPDKLRQGLEQAARQREHWGSTHPTVLTRLGELYAGTISGLRPRIMVQGNPVYLQQPTIVAEIRAILLCALRSAVLWRQLGGSQWDLYLRRKQMLAAARGWLGR